MGMFSGQNTMLSIEESSFIVQSLWLRSQLNDKHGNSSTEHLIVNQLFHPNASLPPVVSAYGVYFFNTIETLNTIDKVKHHIGEKWSQQEEYEENIYATYLGGSQ